MRVTSLILVLAGAAALTAALWWLTGGRAFVFVLPLVLAGPLVWRGRKGV
jgi:hypothetical protein